VTHKFDFKERKKLISDKRKKILPAKKTLIDLGLKKNDIFADIGSGIGYFSFPASKIVGPQGKVYAMDISQDMLNEIKKISEDKNILNIELIKTSENNLIILDDIISFAFTSTVLHEVDNLNHILKEIKRIMVKGGRLSVIEWKKVKSDFGPPIEHRLDPKDLSMGLKKTGYKDIMITILNEYLYSITCFK
jgi:ubiquinone/menaquinone biosynthesis C-methylase UbiE